MSEIRFLSHEEFEKVEIKKVRDLIEKAKPIIEKDPSHRAYMSLNDIDKNFPSKRGTDRYDDSIFNNFKRYVDHFNKKYCIDGCFYKVGTAWKKDGEKVIFLEEAKREKENVDFKPIGIAEIVNDDDNSAKGEYMIGNHKIDLPDNVKDKIRDTENTT